MTDSQHSIGRRHALKTTGAALFGSATLIGTASAHNEHTNVPSRHNDAGRPSRSQDGAGPSRATEGQWFEYDINNTHFGTDMEVTARVINDGTDPAVLTAFVGSDHAETEVDVGDFPNEVQNISIGRVRVRRGEGPPLRLQVIEGSLGIQSWGMYLTSPRGRRRLIID